MLATTTSVGNSGLLGVIQVEFARDSGIGINAHLVGSGRALAMLQTGQAGVIITHAPDAEAAALREHADWVYRKVMFNDFVLIGPRSDPARARDAADAAEAMRRIARSERPFISRGDHSGTHERERQLWLRAGVVPARDRLIAAGQGMGTTLRIAAEMDGYTLADRATFAQNAGVLDSTIVFEGGEQLLNTYAVLFDPAASAAQDARQFANWLTEGRGRLVTGGYRIGGTQAFTPWPAGRARGSPADLPD